MTPDPPTQAERPARVAIPEELARDVAARPEAYRPATVEGAEVLVLADPTARFSDDDVTGMSGRAYLIETQPDRLGVDLGPSSGEAVVSAWALVGSVDGGPRPDVGDRVLVLARPEMSGESLSVGMVRRVIGVVEESKYHQLQGRPLKVESRHRLGTLIIATRWAILPPAPDAEPSCGPCPCRDGECLNPPDPYSDGCLCNAPDDTHPDCPVHNAWDDDDPEPTDAVEGPPARWRVGLSWGRTIVESGTGTPDEQGRRPDDRLVGVVETRADAALIVDAVNGIRSALARGLEIADQRDGYAEDVVRLTRERNDAQAEAERLRGFLRGIARAYPPVGNSAGASAGDLAREALGPAREETT